MRSRVVAIGDLVADITVVVPRFPVIPGATHTTWPARIEPGGSGNFLITAARLGLQALALGALGTDELGDWIGMILQKEGIDLRFVYRLPDSTTTTVLVLVEESSGAHALLGSFGATPPLSWDPAWEALFDESAVVFASGFTLLEPAFRDIGSLILKKAQARGCSIFFDVGPMGHHLAPDDLRVVLAIASVVLLTEEEAEALSMDPARIAREGPVVVIKRGPAGCQILTGEEKIDVPGFPVHAVDPVGAGDSFDAGLVYGWMKGWPLPWAALFANAAGAAKVQKRGTGRQMPTRQEIQKILKTYCPDFPFWEDGHQ
ncbi:MAG: PfkB family carbohydrate kinase [Anaerolineae bacterium]|nr:PfkB family carbohydrate kinase [Thermoflexus sp.]MDW8064519.1 PfkB family carbohydrate kinase [Anaerolineae bacterium]